MLVPDGDAQPGVQPFGASALHARLLEPSSLERLLVFVPELSSNSSPDPSAKEKPTGGTVTLKSVNGSTQKNSDPLFSRYLSADSTVKLSLSGAAIFTQRLLDL